VNVRHLLVVQRDAVVAVVGDDNIGADLLHVLLHSCEVCEDRVIDLQVIRTGPSLQDGVFSGIDGTRE
jgi:hypothetical protein